MIISKKKYDEQLEKARFSATQEERDRVYQEERIQRLWDVVYKLEDRVRALEGKSESCETDRPMM